MFMQATARYRKEGSQLQLGFNSALFKERELLKSRSHKQKDHLHFETHPICDRRI